jgi:hypothetical protein
MANNEALKTIKTLSEGVDPRTGEVLPHDSPFQHGDVIRALYAATEALERQVRIEKRRRNMPEFSGRPWTQEEDQQIVRAFDAGTKGDDIAKKHKRSKGAIVARLVKLGKINV